MSTDINQTDPYAKEIMGRRIKGTYMGDSALPMGIFSGSVETLGQVALQATNDLTQTNTPELAMWGLTLANMLRTTGQRLYDDFTGNTDVLKSALWAMDHPDKNILHLELRRLERVTNILTQAVRNVAYNLAYLELPTYTDFCAMLGDSNLLIEQAKLDDVHITTVLDCGWHRETYLLDDALDQADFGLPDDFYSRPIGNFSESLNYALKILEYVLAPLNNSAAVESLINNPVALKQNFRRVFVATLLGIDQHVQHIFTTLDHILLLEQCGDPVNIMNYRDDIEQRWEAKMFDIVHCYGETQ